MPFEQKVAFMQFYSDFTGYSLLDVGSKRHSVTATESKERALRAHWLFLEMMCHV